MDRLPKPCDCSEDEARDILEIASEFTLSTVDDSGRQIGDAVTYKPIGDKWLAVTVESPYGAVRKLAEEN